MSENQANYAATVLVVDDDPGARLLVGTALEMAGFRVVTAADGEAALESISRASGGLRGARRGHAGHERFRCMQRAARFAGVPPRADSDADQSRRHGIGQPRLQCGSHGFLLQGHQSDAARAARQIPGARQADPGSAARERGACALSRLLRSSHRAAEPPAPAADSGAADRVGAAAATRLGRADARRRQFLPHQRYAGPGGGRCCC